MGKNKASKMSGAMEAADPSPRPSSGISRTVWEAKMSRMCKQSSRHAFSDAQNDLSPSRQRLLSLILAEADETFYLSSREMGRRYGVDTATIVRTIQAMGYKKFADFAARPAKSFCYADHPVRGYEGGDAEESERGRLHRSKY